MELRPRHTKQAATSPKAKANANASTRCVGRATPKSYRVLLLFLVVLVLLNFESLLSLNANYVRGGKQTTNRNSTVIGGDGGRCAIVIHGLPRSFKTVVLPTLKHNVILPNAQYQCDYFIHHHVQDYEDVPSHPGKSGFSHSNDVLELEAIIIEVAREHHHHPQIQFINSTDDECFARHAKLLSKTHSLKDKEGHWLYFPQVIRSWDGLELAWHLLETTQHEFNRDYERVAVLPSDLAYVTPVYVNQETGHMRRNFIVSGASSTEQVGGGWVRGWTSALLGKKESTMGSRIVHGSYDAVKLWATERFNQIDDYLEMLVDNTSGSGFSEETFLADVMFSTLEKNEYSIEFDRTICALDVMPDESVSLFGCGKVTSNKKILEKIIKRPCSNQDKSQSISCTSKDMALAYTNIKKDTAVICSIVKNEEAFLDEWIDYHLGIGFEHIYIYDNTDNYDLGHGWLDRRPRLRQRVTIQSHPGIGQQGPAYKDCVKNHALKNGHRWVGHFDVDEFLVLRSHTSVVPFLSKHCKQGALSLNWQLQTWSHRLQYSPEPVTKRFQWTTGLNQHVKTIANVKHVKFRHYNPHFPTLKRGYHQVDTNGDIVEDNWRNTRYPDDVGVFYHHSTKSWKEYIGKRMRGRADLKAGKAHDESVSELLANAKEGIGLMNATETDSLAWDALKSVNKKYQFFDMEAQNQRAQTTGAISPAICCVATDQEAYIDEWVDYHIGIGLYIYIYDSSENFWMRQWGDERNKNSSIVVTHFPGNALDPSHKAKAFANCLSLHRTKHSAVALMGVHDFLMFPERRGLDPLNAILSSQTAPCAYQLENIVFGHSGRFVHEPLPVTKRFMFRLDANEAAIATSALLLTNSVEMEGDIFFEQLEDALRQYFQVGKWNKSHVCPVNLISSLNIVVYHYLRSVKECNMERNESKICNLQGTVEDQFGWQQIQTYLPAYSGYNDFL